MNIDVERDTVADYYSLCELDNIVEGDAIRLKKGLYHSNSIRLLEALSFTYRANFVFDFVYSDKYRWEKREVSIDNIILSGMGEQLTDTIYSDEVDRNPRKFIEYIKNHPNDTRFDELKPREVPVDRQTILLREHDGKLKMLDGSHRFLSMIMNGMTRITAYVAILNDTAAKPTVGDTIFLRLRCFWESTDDEMFKASIEQTVRGMVAESSDGADAVQAYWVAMGPSKEVKAAGGRILSHHVN